MSAAQKLILSHKKMHNQRETQRNREKRNKREEGREGVVRETSVQKRRRERERWG